MIAKKTKPAAKAPVPRGRKKTHKKPDMPKWTKEAEAITCQMYSSLTASGAPKASTKGYVMGACMTLKMLFDQAVKQGEDHDALKAQIITYVSII